MADIIDDAAAQVNAALAGLGSKLTMDGGQQQEPTPVVTQSEPVVADHPEDATPVVEQIEPLDEPQQQTQTPDMASQIATALEQRAQGFASKDDVQAINQSIQTTQQQIAALLQVLAQQSQQSQQSTQPQPTQPQHEITLLEAQDAYYLHGDRTKLEAYVAQEQAKEQAQRQAEQQRVNQQGMVMALSNAYPFLQNGEGWNAMMAEYKRLESNPLFKQALGTDPSMVVSLGGNQINLRVAALAAETVRARAEVVQATQQQRQQQQQTQQTNERQTQAPGVQGGQQQQQRTPQTPTHLLPADMVSGDDALLNNPEIRRALSQAGWGNDPRTIAKHLAEKLPPKTKQTLLTQYRQGQTNRVRSA